MGNRAGRGGSGGEGPPVGGRYGLILGTYPTWTVQLLRMPADLRLEWHLVSS